MNMRITQKSKKVKSFGKIYKKVLTDINLSVKAKALYSYLCAYAGKNRVAYPRKERICNELGIVPNSFKKYISELINAGYIIKISKFFVVTKYQIVELDGDYGIVEKEVMQNSGLDIGSKALYAYISSFSGSYASCTLRKDTVLYHLNISATTFAKYLKELFAYVDMKQERCSDGTFSNNKYTIISRQTTDENRTQEIPYTKICTTIIVDYNNSSYDNKYHNSTLQFINIINHLKDSLKKRKNKYKRNFQSNTNFITDDDYIVYIPPKVVFG